MKQKILSNLVSIIFVAVMTVATINAPIAHHHGGKATIEKYVEPSDGPWWSPGTWATWVLNAVDAGVAWAQQQTSNPPPPQAPPPSGQCGAGPGTSCGSGGSW